MDLGTVFNASIPIIFGLICIAVLLMMIDMIWH